MKVTLITLTSLLVSTAISSTSAGASAASSPSAPSTASIDLTGLSLNPSSTANLTTTKKELAEPSPADRKLAASQKGYWNQFAGNHDELTAKIKLIKGPGLAALKKAATDLEAELSSKEKSEDKITAARSALAAFNYAEAPFTNKGKNAAALIMTLFGNTQKNLPFFNVDGLSKAKDAESVKSLILAYEKSLTEFEKAHTDNLALKPQHAKIAEAVKAYDDEQARLKEEAAAAKKLAEDIKAKEEKAKQKAREEEAAKPKASVTSPAPAPAPASTAVIDQKDEKK